MASKSFPLSLLAAALLTACGGGATDSASNSTGAPRLLASIAVNTTQNFTGARANYTVSKTASGYTVKDNVGAGGTVTIATGITKLVFADVSVNLEVAALAASIPAADLKTLIEIYIAFFNRLPDADGLAYWIGQFKSGKTFAQIGESFHSVAVSAEYSALTGYTATMSNDAFIGVIYKNVLGRSEVDSGGLKYWNDRLNAKLDTRGSLAASILSSAHTYKGDAQYGAVADLLDNKASAGNTFAVQRALTFLDNAKSFSMGVQMSSSVTATSTAVVDAIIGSISPAVVDNSGGGVIPDGGSGQGSYSDCYNPALNDAGTTYTITTRTKTPGTAATDGTATFTVIGNATFRGQSATEMKIEASVGDTGGASIDLRTYNQVQSDFVYGLGGLTTMTLPGLGTIKTTTWNVPASKHPTSMAVNSPYTQTYVMKSESSSTLFPAVPDSTITETLTFLGTEDVTVPAGTFNACKMKSETTVTTALTPNAAKTISYNWVIASGTYRGLAAKSADTDGTTNETVKLVLNGK